MLLLIASIAALAAWHGTHTHTPHGAGCVGLCVGCYRECVFLTCEEQVRRSETRCWDAQSRRGMGCFHTCLHFKEGLFSCTVSWASLRFQQDSIFNNFSRGFSSASGRT